MSASDNAVQGRVAAIQARIDALPVGQLFTFQDLFDVAGWADLTSNGRYSKTVTKPFWQRISGCTRARHQIFQRVQVLGVRDNGRKREFERIAGAYDPTREEWNDG